MKIRTQLVSNSSSSSFIVYKNNITPLQHYIIVHHGDIARFIKKNYKNLSKFDLYMYEWIEDWDVDDSSPYYIFCSTLMDNFDLMDFLNQFDIICEKKWHSNGEYE